jgi:hypothetical protein
MDEIVKIGVLVHGEVVVEPHGHIYRGGHGIIALSLGLGAPFTVLSTGSEDGFPTIAVLAIGGSRATGFFFPEHGGWRVWSTEVSKETLLVCLVMPKEQHDNDSRSSTAKDAKSYNKHI